jgi:hypothetical protein
MPRGVIVEKETTVFPILPEPVPAFLRLALRANAAVLLWAMMAIKMTAEATSVVSITGHPPVFQVPLQALRAKGFSLAFRGLLSYEEVDLYRMEGPQ